MHKNTFQIENVLKYLNSNIKDFSELFYILMSKIRVAFCTKFADLSTFWEYPRHMLTWQHQVQTAPRNKRILFKLINRALASALFIGIIIGKHILYDL